MNRVSATVAVTVLSVVVLWKGVLPAVTTMDTDFPNYYTSSRLLLDGKETSRLYDDDWFQEQIRSYGINRDGKFSPFPPVTAFLMIPLALFSPSIALVLWTFLKLLLCVLTILLLSRMSDRDWRWSSLLLLGAGIGLINDFRFGQWYLVLTFLMLSGYYVLERGNPAIAGVLFGMGAAFKYFPVVFLPILVVRREWRSVLSFALTIVGIYSLGVLILGTSVFEKYFSSIIIHHLTGDLYDPYSPTYQSWNSLLRRLFIYHPVFNPMPAVHSEVLFSMLKYGIIILILALTTWVLRRGTTVSTEESAGMQFAVISLAGLLLLPASATYHFLLLILPLILLLRGKKHWNIWHKLLVSSYLCIGYLPYRFFRELDGSQWLSLLGYPRLWFMTVLFLAGSMVVVKNTRYDLPSDSVGR